MAENRAQTNLQYLTSLQYHSGVRTHGYSDDLGHAYFIGVQVGDNWQLFGQQYNPLTPGVSHILQLWP
jgi:hypothetical protein